MGVKTLNFKVNLKSTTPELIYSRHKVYTNDDNAVKLEFAIQDFTTEELTAATASLLLYMRDGSFFQIENTNIDLTETTFSYTLQGTQGKHDGVAQAQLLVTIGTAELATQKYEFEIISGLDQAVAVEVMIQDWTTLTAEARAFIDQAELDETQRIANENERIAAENQRINDFSSKADKTYADAELLKKVDKVEGKGLSTNDFDNTYKQKIDIDIPAQLAETEQEIMSFKEDYATQVEAIVNSLDKTNKVLADSTFNNLWKTGTPTVDIVSNTITLTGHGFTNNQPIEFGHVTGVLPMGILAYDYDFKGGEYYYIINATTDTFQISLTRGGSVVDIIDTGTSGWKVRLGWLGSLINPVNFTNEDYKNVAILVIGGFLSSEESIIPSIYLSFQSADRRIYRSGSQWGNIIDAGLGTMVTSAISKYNFVYGKWQIDLIGKYWNISGNINALSTTDKSSGVSATANALFALIQATNISSIFISPNNPRNGFRNGTRVLILGRG